MQQTQLPAQQQLMLKDLAQYLNRIPELLSQVKGRKALVLGDVGLDEYLLGEVRRVSPEAPVPVLEVLSQDSRLGLTGNVAQNVASLGGQVDLISVCGKDEAALILKEKLKGSGVEGIHFIEDLDRPTTRKVRAMSGHHHLLRVDFERTHALSKAVEAHVIKTYEEKLKNCDVVIVEDYAKGFFSPHLMATVIELAHKAKKLVMVDPNPKSNAMLYQGSYLMTPNRDEAVALSGVDYDELRDDKNLLLKVGTALRDKLGLTHLVMTRGRDGMSLFSDQGVTHLPTFAKQVFDVTGAGDTVIAALALAHSTGADLISSCVFANLAAGVVVGKVGCVPCSQEELLAAQRVALEAL